MITYEGFEQELREALAHLYDPDYQPSEAFCATMCCDPRDGALAIQTAVLHTIEDLEPPSNTPPTAHTKQAYDLLHSRFVLRLTQEEVAERMSLGRTTVYRLQRRSVHTLARTLWERSRTRDQSAETQEQGAQPSGEDESATQTLDWRSQVHRELASLQEKAPGVVSDVGEAINSLLEVTDALASDLGVRVEVKSVQPGLVATVHPVVLHQILISAAKRLARHIVDGQIAVYARLEDGNAKVTLTGTVAAGAGFTEEDLWGNVPISKDISIEVCIDDTQAFVWIEAPSVRKVTVLVVDDNEEMARFYQRSTVGTRYHIVRTAQGQGLFETIDATTPDIIVLDVMLPDIDGWRLLMRLHEDHVTRSIPVIVCSVVREEDLALSLGATRYLPKPVRPREFTQALDQVLLQAGAATLISPASS